MSLNSSLKQTFGLRATMCEGVSLLEATGRSLVVGVSCDQHPSLPQRKTQKQGGHGGAPRQHFQSQPGCEEGLQREANM